MVERNGNTGGPPGLPSGRLPIGLTLSMVTIGCSLGLMVVVWNVGRPTANPLAFIAHASAVLCVAWGILAHVLCRRKPRLAASPYGHDLIAVLQVTQLVLGLAASVVMFYVATTAVLTRIPSLPFFAYEARLRVEVWPTGLLDVALVAVAALVAWWRTGNGALMTALMWLMVFMSLWAALQIPATVVRAVGGISREVAVDWVSPFVAGASFAMTGFTCIAGRLAHQWRVAAWPDRLDDLLRPPPPWPGFGYSAGIVAAMVMVLGSMLIVSPLTPAAAFMSGGAMLALAARRWHEDYADAGLGLITLGVLAVLMVNTPEISASRAEYFGAVFSRAVLGLAVMTAFWHWLAEVWHQQLDAGRAWTTAGRLIRPCRRVSFLLATIGVLVAIHLAFWPKLSFVYVQDDSVRRCLWGLLAEGTLVVSLTWVAVRTGKATLAWLASFAAVSTVAFVVVRLTGTALYVGFLRYWPLLLAGAAAALLVAAHLCGRRRRWTPFVEPAYVGGALLAPVAAIAGATLVGSRSMPPWVVPATFGILAAVYLLAAALTGPRRFIVLTLVCAAAAVWTWRRG